MNARSALVLVLIVRGKTNLFLHVNAMETSTCIYIRPEDRKKFSNSTPNPTPLYSTIYSPIKEVSIVSDKYIWFDLNNVVDEFS